MAQQQPDLAALARQFGGQPITDPAQLNALAKQFGGTQSAAPAVPTPKSGGGIGDFLGGLWDNINPFPAIKMLVEAPVQRRQQAHEAAARGDFGEAVKLAMGASYTGVAADMAKGALQSQWNEITKAWRDFGQGRYTEGAGHALAGVLPLIGPAAAKAGETIAEGQIARGLGEGVGLIGGVVGPAAVSRMRGGTTGSPFANRNPKGAAAVEFVEQSGVPMDAATATGNPFVRGAQALSEHTIPGSLVSQRARAAQQTGLATLGEQLAAKASQPSAVTAEQAGAALRSGVRQQIATQSSIADEAYDALRAMEKNPKYATTVTTIEQGRVPGGGAIPIPSKQVMIPMAVDLRAPREALKPIHQELSRQRDLAPAMMMGDKARAFDAIDRLVRSPDAAPLSVVDGALGDLKAFVRRGGDLPSAGQAVVSRVVKELEQAVQQAAKDAGPEVVRALERGRSATVLKYKAADVLDRLHKTEDVKSFRAATAQKDSAIDLLRELAREAPAEMPKVGRAYLDDLLTSATAEGGFGKGASIWKQWDDLGTETKRLLYPDPSHVSQLNKFFLAAKRMGESPNTSGTALVAHVGSAAGIASAAATGNIGLALTGAGMQLAGGALAKFLHSPTGVRLLTKGFTIPSGQKAAVAAWLSQVLKYAHDNGIEMGEIR